MWSNPGELLRIWREQVALDPITGSSPSLRLVEARCRAIDPVDAPSHMTIHNWEHWRTARSAPPAFQRGLVILDKAYGAGGALQGLALATPKVFPPRISWAHNFDREPVRQGPRRTHVSRAGETPSAVGRRAAARHDWVADPVWLWLRPGNEAGGMVDASVRWGPIEARIQRDVGSDGLLLTSRVSTPRPAVYVTFHNAPGWVDFGFGSIPPGLGIVTVREADVVFVSETRLEPIQRLMRDWGRLVSPEGLSEAAELIRQALICAPHLPEVGGGRADATKVATDGARDPWSGALDGPGYRQLRLRRGLGLAYAAEMAMVSARQLGYFEAGSRTTVTDLASRLDRVYDADGFTCREPVEVQRGVNGSVVTIPPHWVGPVVLTLHGPLGSDDLVEMDLSWGGWTSRLLVREGLGITFRSDGPGEGPMLVSHPSRCRLTVELGYNPDVVDVGLGNWVMPREAVAEFAMRYVPLLVELQGLVGGGLSEAPLGGERPDRRTCWQVRLSGGRGPLRAAERSEGAMPSRSTMRSPQARSQCALSRLTCAWGACSGGGHAASSRGASRLSASASRARSSASCRGWPSSWCGAFA